NKPDQLPRFVARFLETKRYETFPPTISASGRGLCRATVRVALRFGASLSDASDTVDRAIPGGWLDRPHCTPDRSMADGAARPAIGHREPVGRRRQYRQRGGPEFAA